MPRLRFMSHIRPLCRRLAILIAVILSIVVGRPATAEVKHVIQISVDGGGSYYIQTLIDWGQLPNFKRFQVEGATTMNARTDFDYTVTLPNHTAMITGRPVLDKRGPNGPILGHLWTKNDEPETDNLHLNARAYVKSAFDVAHDHGLRTFLAASKTKFVLYDQSYDVTTGAPDGIGPDNGRDKIDVAIIDTDADKMLEKYLDEMRSRPANYSFVHFANADAAGHAHTWGSSEYVAALKKVDEFLALILELASTHPELKDSTVVIVSADHGGIGDNHGTNSDWHNYTIPFLTWGAGVAAGADLYQLNVRTRRNLGRERIDFTEDGGQPIRNGDGGNLALKLLGLPAIPDSFINAGQDLRLGE